MNIIFNKECAQHEIKYTFEYNDKDLNTQYPYAKAFGFAGKLGQLLSVSHIHFLVGMGKAADMNPHNARKLGTLLAQQVGTKTAICLDLINIPYALKLEGFYLRYWSFNKYHIATAAAHTLHLEHLDIKCSEEVEQQFNQLLPVLKANHWVRSMSEEPANVCDSNYMEEQAKKLLSDNITVKVLNKEELKALNMNALLGVASGSAVPPKLIVIEYNGIKNSTMDNEKPYVFVGKGVLFDSGGISLKPAADMDKMKKDMTGAATVIGILQAIKESKLEINAVGILAVVENMISGTAQRPGDIWTTANGQTVEILNTDAEGRLILSDALWYAQKFYQPKCIIDYATLTGAILIALGNTYAGMYTRHDTFAASLTQAGDTTGELVWRMPLHADFDEDINSAWADVANLGKSTPLGGSNTAAAFLARFVSHDIPWVHLDMASTAYAKSAKFCAGVGSTGYGVRLTYNWLLSQIK